MSTLTPSPVRSRAGQQTDRLVPRPPGPLSGSPDQDAEGPKDGGNTWGWLRRKSVAVWMNLLIAAVAVVTAVTAGFLPERHWPDPQTWGAWPLKLFALWCLSFLPGWLYVRFLDMRGKALWNEYVLNLHRLAWDMPWYLPEPPLTSEFHELWAQRGKKQDPRRPAGNIYQQKFEAYYGRQIPSAAMAGRPAGPPDEPDSGPRNRERVSAESLFPIFMATAVLAAGWAAVLWDTRFVTAPAGPWDVLKYGFLGSYAFVTSMLIRRFFQSDLRPSAYASSVLRIVLVLLIVAVLHQVIGGTSKVISHAELASAFVVGFFPLVGLQALQRVTSKVLGGCVPSVTSEYPLDRLDGFNLWYEARLTEEGVEDMQNLTTMNLVDVILHTRVPVGRLVDWIDQSFLLIHLKADDGGRDDLRRVGIRTATDLLKVFSAEQDAPCGALPQRRFAAPEHVQQLPLPDDQLRLLVAVLSAEPGLAPVWNWQQNGVSAGRSGSPRVVRDLAAAAVPSPLS